MNTSAVTLRRLTAAACATVITAVGAWAFASSTASTDRDPFHFASMMAANAAANAQVRIAQQGGTATVCGAGAETPD
ncbi:MAG: hypothetical protein JO299_13020, partial [Gammaproteobacteria bacterium]|nr:hypothetical protein [Gammaproteobacteria bacterium]